MKGSEPADDKGEIKKSEAEKDTADDRDPSIRPN